MLRLALAVGLLSSWLALLLLGHALGGAVYLLLAAALALFPWRLLRGDEAGGGLASDGSVPASRPDPDSPPRP